MIFAALASTLATVGEAVATGAQALGSAVATGAEAVGGAVASGAEAVGSVVTKGAEAVGGAVKNGAEAVANTAKGLSGKDFITGFADNKADLIVNNTDGSTNWGRSLSRMAGKGTVSAGKLAANAVLSKPSDSRARSLIKQAIF